VDTQIAGTSQTFGANYPGLAALLRERDKVRRRLAGETERVRGSILQSYAAATAQVADLSSQLAALKQEAAAATDYETQIASMVRDTEIKRTLYVDLSQRASQLETERRVLAVGAQLVNLAEKPIKPSFPRPMPFLVGGLTLGCIPATAAALRRDQTDHRLRTTDALQTLPDLAVLTCIPVADRGRWVTQHGERAIALRRELEQLQTPSMLQEAVRGLFPRLNLAGFSGGPSRTLLVTSLDAREGKTFVALALAEFAAASGQSVLLVECDLRRPSLQAALEIPK